MFFWFCSNLNSWIGELENSFFDVTNRLFVYFFFCCTRANAFPFFQKLINVAYWIIIVFGKFQEINKHSPYNKNMMCILHKFLLKTIEQTYFFSIFFHCFQIAIAILWMIWYVTCQAFVQHICAYIHDISTVHTYLWP